MSRIWHYVAAVVGYWQFWVAVAFMIERSMERFFPKRAAALNVLLPVEGRRKLFIGIAIVAFVYANFRAFDAAASLKRRLAATGRRTVGQGSQATKLRPCAIKFENFRPRQLTSPAKP
jgi:hypothetical protein